MSEGIKILPNYSYADYEKWEGKWELIEGIPYAISPQPAPRHQRIAVKLSSKFDTALENCSRCAVYQPIDYLVAKDIVLQPDMLVVCGDIKKKYLDFSPALVAEILSSSTVLKDRHTKYNIYQSQGIPYYIIIAPDTDEAEIYKLENNAYVLKQKGKDFLYEFHFEECNAVINFKEIW